MDRSLVNGDRLSNSPSVFSTKCKENLSHTVIGVRINSVSASRTSKSLGAEHWKRQLELAIAWNRVDIAKTEIFTEESQWKVGLPVHHNKSTSSNLSTLYGGPSHHH